MSVQKCPLCKKKYDDKIKLSEHIERKHGKEIPEGWSGLKYIFYSKHGRTTGKCIICKKDTKFNESTGKPNRLCDNPNCVKQMRQNAVNNMTKVYGKASLLDDPDFQKKMLMNRKISKDYHWSDGKHVKRVVGSFEYNGMQFLDLFMNFDPDDVIVPAPMVVAYEYEGKTHFYIPDAYISSLNVILEFKDGGDNPNTHPKIQAVDKEKERLKEEAIKKLGKYHYVKVANKQYSGLMKALIELKNREDYDNPKELKPIMITNEMTNILSENLIRDEVPITEILLFYEKDLPIITEIGLRVDDTIYVTRADYLAREELSDVVVTKRFLLAIPDRNKQIIKERVDMFIGAEMNPEITPINCPIALLYEIFLPYDDITLIEQGEAYDIFSLEDYLKFQWIVPVEYYDENALKNLLIDNDNDEDILMTTDMEIQILPDEILSEFNFPIKGLNFPVNNDAQFNTLEKLYKSHKIPSMFINEVREFLYNNKDLYNIDENLSEAKVDRNTLQDSDFGIPEERKYPLTDKNHVLLAVRYFNKCEKKYKKTLANNINKRAKELNLTIGVGRDNDFYEYADKEILKEEYTTPIGREENDNKIGHLCRERLENENNVKIKNLILNCKSDDDIEVAEYEIDKIESTHDKELFMDLLDAIQVRVSMNDFEY